MDYFARPPLPVDSLDPLNIYGLHLLIVSVRGLILSSLGRHMYVALVG